ncbi:MAG: DUF2461 family protein [Ignavibacteriaceae bacterium]|nr:DUF2461 family protein [Ignavibacteriaceae bacterium]
MIQKIPVFEGFHPGAFKYLRGLGKNNNARWFAEHRDEYEEHLVLPAKSFITAVAPFFNQVNPGIRTEPKFNQTIMRISNDMRFSKGDPYKDYFLIHFGRFKMDSEFYLYFDKAGISFGLFLNSTEGEELYFKRNLNEYEKEIKELFIKYKLNGKFGLHSINKKPELVINKFKAERDFNKLKEVKHILLEIGIGLENKQIYTSEILTRTIKVYSSLYPLYCFAITPDPLKYLEAFEENMGVLI